MLFLLEAEQVPMLLIIVAKNKPVSDQLCYVSKSIGYDGGLHMMVMF